MQPLFWLCGCPYSPGHVPGLPSEFVRQCDVHLADEFAAFKDHGEFVLQAQCQSIQIDQSLIPWICPSEHDAIFGFAGVLRKYAKETNEKCSATSTLLHEVIQPEHASLPQVRLLGEALDLLQKAPDSIEHVQKTVLKMRDQAMREYLGFWWYFSVWKKSEAPTIKAELEKLIKGLQESNSDRDNRNQCSSENESTDSGYESTSSVTADYIRPWLMVLTEPMILQDDALTVLDAFDRTHGYPTSWTLYDGDDPSIILARQMRRLFLDADSISRECIDRAEKLEQTARIQNVVIPDLALLLMEQAVLNKALDEKTRKHLQNISDTHLELLSESAAAARKEAANEMLRKVVRIWRLRYARYNSKSLTLPVLDGEAACVILQVVPNSITDFVHGDEPVVIRILGLDD